MMKLTLKLAVLLLSFSIVSCGGDSKKTEDDKQEGEAPVSMLEEESDPMENKGIGPVSSIELGEIDDAMAKAGEEVFTSKCTACHKTDKKFIGPAPTGVLDRRSPEWVMNMILNPEQMTKEDPIAKQLLIDHNGSPMANQNLTEAEARSVLEYFRTL